LWRYLATAGTPCGRPASGSFRGSLTRNQATYIGADFTMDHEVPFDQAYMRALFDYGYQLGRVGYPWRKAPPILEAPAQTVKAELQRKLSVASEQSEVP
jgi:hypothetical protein